MDGETAGEGLNRGEERKRERKEGRKKGGKIIIYWMAEIVELEAYSGEGWSRRVCGRAINLSFTGRNSKL